MVYYDYNMESWVDEYDTRFSVKMTTKTEVIVTQQFKTRDEFEEWHKDIEVLEGYAKALHQT